MSNIKLTFSLSFACIVMFILVYEAHNMHKPVEELKPLLKCTSPFDEVAVFEYDDLGQNEILTGDNRVFNLENCIEWRTNGHQ